MANFNLSLASYATIYTYGLHGDFIRNNTNELNNLYLQLYKLLEVRTLIFMPLLDL